MCRFLALKYHPDRNADPESHILFMVLSEAYAVLGKLQCFCSLILTCAVPK
jgi:curved DNA-binding protein CbpA